MKGAYGNKAFEGKPLIHIICVCVSKKLCILVLKILANLPEEASLY